MYRLTCFLIVLCSFSLSLQAQIKQVDYDGFLSLSDSLRAFRQSRLVDAATFNEMAKDSNTIILDTRSKRAFDDIHVAGAVHLNFSDFTKHSLQEMIPDKNTRILIYCNNNFESNRSFMANKAPVLALNIPTFINLVGYGYENVYELSEFILPDDNRIDLVINNDNDNFE